MFLNVGTGPFGAGYCFPLSGAFPGVELTHRPDETDRYPSLRAQPWVPW